MNKTIIQSFVCSFLVCFMLLIFGPAEIYFSNITQFQFAYADFAGRLAVIAGLLTFLLTLIGILLKRTLRYIYFCIIFSVSMAGYVQIMFLNKRLDLLGMNPDKNVISIIDKVGNLIIWLSIFIVLIFCCYYKKELWKKIVFWMSLFLLMIQATAYVTLIITENKSGGHQNSNSNMYISGEKQFMVSANDNIIVFVLDMFSNNYLNSLETSYPGATSCLHDFTYYSNYDSTYMGTYPSLAHMLTGCEVDMKKSVNDWCEDIWTNSNTTRFYLTLAEQNYVVNLYTPSLHVLTGMNDANLLASKFSNILKEGSNKDIDYGLLLKTMFKISAYRMTPEILKPYFYTNMHEYSDIVQSKDKKVYHNNYDFYEKLCSEGLSVDQNNNYYIIQHLMGAHEYTTDEFGHYKDGATLDETTKGCMTILEKYFTELKRLGVYDKSTIIVTADHGSYDTQTKQVIFYIKEPGEHHEKSPVCTSPVSHREFFPTIVYAAGEDPTNYGKTIYDIENDPNRERTYWQNMYDADYPIVPYYTQKKDGNSNVYYQYTYIGDANALDECIREGEPDAIIPMVDSIY